MTYIKLSGDMSLTVTVAEPIYRGDNLNKCITFLVPASIQNIDSATLFLSYIRADGTADMVILERDDTMYNQDYYQYYFPVTCKLSKYPGAVCMWIQIMNGDADDPIIGKSGECTIKILESKSMDAYLCDHQLLAMYQLKKKVDELTGESSPDDGTGGEDGSDDSGPAEGDGYPAVEF